MRYDVTFTCPACDAFHFTEHREFGDMLMRAGTIAIDDCPKCKVFHAYVSGNKPWPKDVKE